MEGKGGLPFAGCFHVIDNRGGNLREAIVHQHKRDAVRVWQVSHIGGYQAEVVEDPISKIDLRDRSY